MEKSFTATTNLLIPATPMPCVLRCVPVAALDHLRGRESILPLPQPASLSDAEITLRDLVETTQDVDRVQHLWEEAGQKVSEWLVVAGVTRCQVKVPHTGSAWWHCCSGSRGKASAASKCHHHLAVPSKT